MLVADERLVVLEVVPGMAFPTGVTQAGLGGDHAPIQSDLVFDWRSPYTRSATVGCLTGSGGAIG